MGQSNEFHGRTLVDAVKFATEAYRPRLHETKSQRRCNDLALEISSLKSQIGRAADKAERLADDADQLRRNARVQLALSALAGLGTLARSLRALALIARRIKNRDISRLTKREILDLLATLGPIGAAIGAVYAIHQLAEAERLARQAENVEQDADRLGELLLGAVDDYVRSGCGQRRRLQS